MSKFYRVTGPKNEDDIATWPIAHKNYVNNKEWFDSMVLELLFTKDPNIAVCKIFWDQKDLRPGKWEDNIILLPRCFLTELTVKNIANHDNAWILSKETNELIIITKTENMGTDRNYGRQTILGEHNDGNNTRSNR